MQYYPTATCRHLHVLSNKTVLRVIGYLVSHFTPLRFQAAKQPYTTRRAKPTRTLHWPVNSRETLSCLHNAESREQLVFPAHSTAPACWLFTCTNTLPERIKIPHPGFPELGRRRAGEKRRRLQIHEDAPPKARKSGCFRSW